MQQIFSQSRLDCSEKRSWAAKKHRDLGAWTGLQNAFAAVAGSCSAARAQCLKQVRHSRMLDDLGLTWEEFCHDYAGISHRHANDLIRQYDRFGDLYFRLSEIVRVSPETFQQIAGHVDGDTVDIDGEHLKLVPENAAKTRAAIHSLRNQVRHPPAPARPAAGVIELRSLSVYAVNKFREVARGLLAAG